jgi:8-oxo-dGTP pyrophosphatase MutT (NUDIX family)
MVPSRPDGSWRPGGAGLAYAARPMGRADLAKGEEKPDIRAAGGVVLRRGDDRRTRAAVIHRPKYQDWSLPKGKLEKGESWREAARREVEEETGFRPRVGRELPAVSYRDRKGRRKHVRYWLMEPEDGRFEPHGEVDELRWLTRREAEGQLTYEHDRDLVRRAMRAHRWRRLLPWRRSV